jgi:carbamoyl-phosphate synthase large subunit
MNVLLTCVGRRNYLVEFFRNALRGRGQVYGADADRYASALQECDKAFIVRRVEEPGYCDEILALCREHNVRLMIPLIDPELPIIADRRDQFAAIGTIAVVSTSAVVDLCFDKWETAKFLADNGLPHPKTYRDLAAAREAICRGELRFPVVVKPRWGSASLGMEYPEDDDELEMTVRLLKKRLPKTILGPASRVDMERSVLIQERLIGQEYGLDVVNDLCGRYVTTFVRRKLRMRAGETDQALTVTSDVLVCVGQRIGETLGHVGSLDCDVFVNEKRFWVLELNPRFGGGYPFSHVAGADVPAMLIGWATGVTVEASWMRVEQNVLASKCDRIVATRA